MGLTRIGPTRGSWFVSEPQLQMLLCILSIGASSLLSTESEIRRLAGRMAPEDLRLRAIQRAARDGMCTTAIEDAAMDRVGGPHASTYGELTPRGFSALGQKIGLGPADTFVDCGSGLGRLVHQAVHEFGSRRSFGVEYAASRHRLAVALCNTISDGNRVKLIQGDCADERVWRMCLSTCTVAFCSNLLFDRELNVRLQRCLESATSLRTVASLKPWPTGLQGFCKPYEICCETSWSAPIAVVGSAGEAQPHGGSTVYVYERIA